MNLHGKWVVTFLGFCIPVIMQGGCATVRGSAPVNIDQSSPQAVAASYQEGLESENYAAMLECVEPCIQAEFDRLLVARRRAIEKVRAVAVVIAEKIGRKEAEFYRSLPGQIAAFTPFWELVGGAKVNWSRVHFKVEGDMALARTDAGPLAYFRRIGRKWYLGGTKDRGSFGKLMYEAILWHLKTLAANADRHAREIRTGTIHKGNFYPKVMAADAAEAERLGRWAAIPYGPPVDGVRIRLTTSAPAFRKDERIRFIINIKYETDEPICWRMPGMGPNDSRRLGENVVLEIDGKPIPQPDVKADRLVRAGHGGITDSTSIYLPVNFRLPPGPHMIRCTIISPGGTYVEPDTGEKYRIIKGKLVSNTLTFFVSDRKIRPVPDKSGETARWAARAVRRHIEGLSHDNSDVRRFSAASLGEIGQRAKPSVRPLIRALKDEESLVRSAVAEALGDIGPVAKEAVPALRKALRDDNEQVRKAAAEALKKIQHAGKR